MVSSDWELPLEDEVEMLSGVGQESDPLDRPCAADDGPETVIQSALNTGEVALRVVAVLDEAQQTWEAGRKNLVAEEDSVVVREVVEASYSTVVGPRVEAHPTEHWVGRAIASLVRINEAGPDHIPCHDHVLLVLPVLARLALGHHRARLLGVTQDVLKSLHL